MTREGATSSLSQGERGQDRPATRPRLAACRLVLGLVALLAVACNSGSYPVDVFPEMHYQPSQRRLEPERLAAPAGAVPVTGSRPRLTFEQAGSLTNPVPRSVEIEARARELYRVNCAMCHGSDGRGEGPLASYYTQNPAASVPPTDLAAPRVRARADGQLYWLLAEGIGNMPPYGTLLTEQELWTVVHAIREIQARDAGR
jgi:mono/diheme cytochrome c family protein